MQMRSRGVVAILIGGFALIGALLAPAGAGAAPGGNDNSAEARARHDKTTAYWNAKRVAQAKPMGLLRVNPSTGKKVAQGKGCNPRKQDCSGGGDGGDTGGDGGGTGGTSLVSTPSQQWSTSGFSGAAKDVEPITGKVLFTLGPSDGEHDYVCSASIVRDENDGDTEALILTAGHCVYDDVDAVWATNWTFLPDYGNSGADRSVRDCSTNTLGCWTAEQIVTTSRWADAGDFNYDVAFVRVTVGGQDGNTALEDAIDTSGDGASPATVGFNRTRGEFLVSFGYPQAPPYDGRDLHYCADDAKAWDRLNRRWLNSYDQGLVCDITGWSSVLDTDRLVHHLLGFAATFGRSSRDQHSPDLPCVPCRFDLEAPLIFG